jgi:hypothetical protein
MLTGLLGLSGKKKKDSPDDHSATPASAQTPDRSKVTTRQPKQQGRRVTDADNLISNNTPLPSGNISSGSNTQRSANVLAKQPPVTLHEQFEDEDEYEPDAFDEPDEDDDNNDDPFTNMDFSKFR